MATLIFIFIILSFYHFYLESFVIPIKHMHYRHRIKALRDTLIETKNLDPLNLPDNLVIELEQGLTQSFIYLPYLSLLDFKLNLARKSLEDHKEIIKKAIELKNLVEESKRKDIANYIIIEHNKIMKSVYIVNFSGWVIYFLPIFIIFFIYEECKKLSNSILKKKELEFITNEKAVSHFSEINNQSFNKKLVY